MMRRYPVPPSCLPDDTKERQNSELLRIYQEFVLDLHQGMRMMQLSPNMDYTECHCQVREDLQALMMDIESGCIVEFPLTAVTKVHRIAKNDNKWFSAGTLTGPEPLPPLPLSNAEQLVFVEFDRRKVSFVFDNVGSAHSFLMCMELLVRRAHEMRAEAKAGNIADVPRKVTGGGRSGSSYPPSHQPPPSKPSAAQEPADGCTPEESMPIMCNPYCQTARDPASSEVESAALPANAGKVRARDPTDDG
eukprot:NODE_15471_length_1048_cov_5.241042.p1 GENE.NODE_15471_length_1048_cov_5.241042~~NODE_15471_length_1048_cov_5.241042.p1  ORF type:complete len:248 (+),score=82.55 NODE_15471_length_1048_cov_5.241042:52-795(+)